MIRIAIAAAVLVAATYVVCLSSRPARTGDESSAGSPDRVERSGTGALDAPEQRARSGTPEWTLDGSAPRDIDGGSSGSDLAQACQKRCGVECVAGADGAFECPALCNTDDDCGSDELCTITDETPDGERHWRCHRSNCRGPGPLDDCGPDGTCVFLGRMTGGISRCLPVGPRGIDEACAHDLYGSVGRCAKGLACSNGRCRPSFCESDADCGATSRCREIAGALARSCGSWCATDRDCPADLACRLSPSSGMRECVDPAQDRCSTGGCAPGEVCYAWEGSSWSFRTSCERPCAPDVPDSCRPGELCVAPSNVAQTLCVPTCDVEAPRCRDGFKCTAIAADEEPVCLYDLDAATDAYFKRTYP